MIQYIKNVIFTTPCTAAAVEVHTRKLRYYGTSVLLLHVLNFTCMYSKCLSLYLPATGVKAIESTSTLLLNKLYVRNGQNRKVNTNQAHRTVQNHMRKKK